MSRREIALFALLLVDSAALALVELLYLPLRFDGTLLPLVGGGLPFPVSALVALVTMPWLVGVAARLSTRALVAGGPIVAWVLTLLVLGVLGPGGDRVLIADWRTLLLLACGCLPAAVRLGRLLGDAAMTQVAEARVTGGRAHG